MKLDFEQSYASKYTLPQPETSAQRRFQAFIYLSKPHFNGT